LHFAFCILSFDFLLGYNRAVEQIVLIIYSKYA